MATAALSPATASLCLKPFTCTVRFLSIYNHHLLKPNKLKDQFIITPPHNHPPKLLIHFNNGSVTNRRCFSIIVSAAISSDEVVEKSKTELTEGIVGEFCKRLRISDIKGGESEGLDRLGQILTVRGWVRTLRLQSSVTLIEIGIKAEWRGHQGRMVLFLGNKNTAPLDSVQATILPPSHLKLDISLVPEIIPPRAQVQCPLEVVNLHPSRDVAVLDFSYKFGTYLVSNRLRLPAVLNKFLQPIQVSAEEFFPQWRSLPGPPLKLQEVVRGVRPMSLGEMANLLNSLRVMVCPGLDPNACNLVASTTFYSENTRAMLCLIRIETDPADRTQLRMTVASGDPTLTFELKEFIKENLVSIPTAGKPPAPVAQQPQLTNPPIATSDPGALLAGLL